MGIPADVLGVIVLRNFDEDVTKNLKNEKAVMEAIVKPPSTKISVMDFSTVFSRYCKKEVPVNKTTELKGLKCKALKT